MTMLGMTMLWPALPYLPVMHPAASEHGSAPPPAQPVRRQALAYQARQPPCSHQPSISHHPVAEQSHASRHSQQIGVRRHVHPVSCHTSCLPKASPQAVPCLG